MSALSWPTMAEYRPGETALPGTRPQDAKSPPLDDLWPARAPRTLDPAMFHCRDWVRREADALWSRSWICAGLESDARERGQWFSFTLLGRPLFIIRGQDDVLRAFDNVCRHRGAPLLTGDFGQVAGKLVCGFHSWAYATTGQCTRVTDRQFFDAEALAGTLDLAPVRAECWAGFVFITLDPDAASLLQQLGPLPALLDAYDFSAMRVVKDVVVDLQANWKLMLHANLEAYHFHALHSPALAYADDLVQQIDFYLGGHSRFITPTGIPSSRLPPRATIFPEQAELLAEAGVDPAMVKGGPAAVRAALIAAKRRPDNPFGLDYARFSDSQAVDDWSISIFPNMSLNLHPEGVLFMRYLPHPHEAGRSDFHVTILMPKLAPGAGPPAYMGLEQSADIWPAARPPRLRRPDSAPDLGWALDADCTMVPAQQRGMRSPGLGSVRLSELEARIAHASAELARRMSETTMGLTGRAADG
jgi:phenylpropionate dioxygenase-like ring-hydroxylating dioxygenase large terminal subunit